MKYFVPGTLLVISLLLAVAAAAQLEPREFQFTFDHVQHRDLVFPGSPCITCHLPDSPTITPERRACLQCHDREFAEQVRIPGMVNSHGPLWGFNHGPFAKNRQLDCAGCHQQDYCLNCHLQGPAAEMGEFGGPLRNVHRGDFRVGHPLAARTNPKLCASCHEPASCNACHTDFRRGTDHLGRAASPSHRRVFGLWSGGGDESRDIAVIHRNFRGAEALARCDTCHNPGSIYPNIHSWGREHAREARRALQSCQACHPSGDTCIQCHSDRGGPAGINPHGPDWSKNRAERLRQASGGTTCVRCH